MWRAIGTLLNKRKTAATHGIFNKYFTTIGSDLTKNLTDDVTLHWSLPDSTYRFKFHKISEDLSKLSISSKQDVLGIDSKLLGDASDSLTLQVCLLNLCTLI